MFYAIELEIKVTPDSVYCASYSDIYFNFGNIDKLTTKMKDERDDFT